MRDEEITLPQVVESFAGKKIAVIGDLMMDAYIWGTARRISPEAPVPVVETEEESWCLGGAGNVMRNIVTLGGDASAYGVLGDDADSAIVREMLAGYGIDHSMVLADSSRRTTRKQRVLAGGQQLLRIDYEDTKPLAEDFRLALQARLMDDIENRRVDAIIFEDYAKGVLSHDLVQTLVNAARANGIITALDPKPGNLHAVKGITVMKPNRQEAFALAGRKFSPPDCPVTEDAALREVADIISAEWQVEQLLISLAAQGMALFREGEDPVVIPTHAREVFDVSGAGDTVIGTYTLALAAGADPISAAVTANYAAGVVVGKVGTSTATKEEILEFYEKIYDKWGV